MSVVDCARRPEDRRYENTTAEEKKHEERRELTTARFESVVRG